jgi:hypothetical protein
MPVTIELQNLGDAQLGEHALSDTRGEWRLSIAGSRASENREIRVEDPNGFERSYTLAGVPESMSLRQFADLFSSSYRSAPPDLPLPLQPDRNEMSISQQLHLQTREAQMRQAPNANRRLDEHVLRALNRIKKPSTAEEITELLNRDLDPGDRPFQEREVATWLRDAGEKVLSLYWLGNRPRR